MHYGLDHLPWELAKRPNDLPIRPTGLLGTGPNADASGRARPSPGTVAMPIDGETPKYTTAVLSGPISKILGVEWHSVLSEAALRAHDPTGQHRMVNAADYARLWNTLIRKAARPDVSRLLGQRMASGPTIPVLFALSTAPDLATGLSRLAKFKHLFGPLRLVVTEQNRQFSIRVMPDDPNVPVPASLAAPQVVFLHLRVQSLAVRPFAPVAVSMPLPQSERESFVDVFGLVPSEGEAALHYRLDDARIPFVSENITLWKATEADLMAAARMVAGRTTIAERVRACFLDAFSITEPSIAYVCDCLHMSRTTLLRKLSAEGTSFQALLDETRRSLAMRYLTKSDLTNQQIAHLIGYVDPNAFQRAFKKWTGSTPQAMRQAHSV
jgi:AraC-like DNA-binding protein